MSDYKYGYEKLMAENNLQMSDLTEDAKSSITAIKDFEKSIKMGQGRGKDASEITLGKIKASDKMAVQEIVDMLDDEQDRELELNTDPEEEDNDENSYENEDKAEFVRAETVAEDGDPKGVQIDLDLKVAFESGKKIITMVELKSVSKTAHNIIFDTYDESGDNGIVTSNYSLIETDEEVFTLTQNIQ